MKNNDTICAVATPAGVGGIAVIRVSGDRSKELCNKMLRKGTENLLEANKSTFSCFYDGETLVDEVVVTFFAAPHSYTGEDTVEISCHGSVYVQQKIINTLLRNGARIAEAGEFTMRAFINGKLDLSQVEAVADIIDSKSETSHRLAINQLRGGFSKSLSHLRQELVELSALLELELDFSEEDLNFVDRDNLLSIVQTIEDEVSKLAKSFRNGNAIKNGVPVVIAGKPNVGKSTLLNALLNDDRAIVSAIPGTTRDTIEDTVVFEGITFRFIDTAGIRYTDDEIENCGIERSFKAANNALVVLYMVDCSQITAQSLENELNELKNKVDFSDKHLFIIYNKSDLLCSDFALPSTKVETIMMSAKNKEDIMLVISKLVNLFKATLQTNDTLLTNVRHYEAMCKILESLEPVKEGLVCGVSADLLMVDIRQALHYIGLITGEVATDEILGTIFSRFCVGK